MNIQSKSGPNIVAPVTAKASETGQSARDRAIATLVNKPQAQETAVKNPSRVAPEELSAIKAPTPPESQEKSASEPYQTTNGEGKTSTSEVNKVETSTQSEQLSPHYAQLAKKERALRARTQELKAKEDALKAKEQEYQSKFISKDDLTNDPLGVLSKHGLTYEQLTSLILSQGTPEQASQNEAVRRLEAQVQSLRDAQEEDRKSFVEQQNKSYQQALKQIRSDAKNLVTVDPYFEVIRATNSITPIVELIERTYNEEGVLLSVEDAAREVEDYLAERAEKTAKLKKIQTKLTPVVTQTQAPVKQQQQSDSEQPQTKTLTNTMSSSRRLSTKERAILAFKGQLNK